jgi:hypothetical protein
MKSPGKSSLQRGVERQFWCEIAKGLTSEDAALAVGASQAALASGEPPSISWPPAGRWWPTIGHRHGARPEGSGRRRA